MLLPVEEVSKESFEFLYCHSPQDNDVVVSVVLTCKFRRSCGEWREWDSEELKFNLAMGSMSVVLER